jgi:hypothetical protein
MQLHYGTSLVVLVCLLVDSVFFRKEEVAIRNALLIIRNSEKMDRIECVQDQLGTQNSVYLQSPVE